MHARMLLKCCRFLIIVVFRDAKSEDGILESIHE
jgi:hypothetical protein